MLTAILRAVPIWAWAMLAALAWGGWQRHQAHAATTELRDQQHQAAVLREADLAAKAVESQRRVTAQQGVIHATEQQAARARAAGAAAAGELQQLRAALAARAGRDDPAAASPGEADRLADALGSCASRLAGVAQAADDAIIAGQACERSYDALMPP